MKFKLLAVVCLLSTVSFLRLILPTDIYAVCPICTVAVGAGLGISRTLGIDDTVTSIWIGGLVLSSSLWIIDWIKRKKTEFPISNFQFPIIGLFYFLILVPLKLSGSIGIAGNKLWAIDKILLGTTIGSLAFLSGVLLDKKIRKIKGRQIFNFQKIVFPVSLLTISSFIVYFLTKN